MNSVFEYRQMEFRRRIDQLGLRMLLVSQTPFIFHLTGWLPPSWVTAFLCLSQDELILVSSFVPDDLTPTWSKAITFETFSLEGPVSSADNTITALKQAVHQAGGDRGPVGAALDSLPTTYGLALSHVAELHDAGDLMRSITTIKDEAAQSAIRQRVQMLDKGFEAAARTIRVGRTEIDVYVAIHSAIAQALGTSFVLDCNLGSGPRSLLDPEPSNRVMAEGEVVLIDLLPMLNGYAADYTRNFVVGEPTDAQRSQHAALEKALAAVEAILRPGVLASEVDTVARHVIESEGFGPYCYTHHTGHGFGLFVQEPPWLIPGNDEPLQAGMVIAVEPGIYHPDTGGMRLEGDYIITEDGCQSLAGYPPVLTACRD